MKIIACYIQLICSLFFFLIALEAAADQTPLQQRQSLLADQAWVLNNLGKHAEAEKIYHNLIKQEEVPVDVYFEYLNLLLSQQRFHEAEESLKRLDALIDEDSPTAQHHRFALIKAEILKAKGEYGEAVEALPQDQKEQNLLYIAPIYLYANNFTEAVRLLHIVTSNPEYSTEEKRRAKKILIDIERLRSGQLQVQTYFIHNKTYGALLPLETTFSRPLSNWGKLQLHHYTLQEKHSIACKLIHLDGFAEQSSLSLFVNENNLGAKGQWEYKGNAGNLKAKLFYNDLERDVTALLIEFAQKQGGELGGGVTLPGGWHAGITTSSSRYYFSTGDFIGEMHSFHPYISHTIFSDLPTLQQQIGYFAVRGKGNSEYMARQFDMGYYSLSGSYQFGIHQNILNYSIMLGSLSGENFSGFAVTPKLEMRYSLTDDLDFTANIEYRTDMAAGDNETRNMVGLNWRY